MTIDGVEYEVVWDGRRPVAPPVAPEPTRTRAARRRVGPKLAGQRARARANKAAPRLSLMSKRDIWHALKTPRPAIAIAHGLCLPRVAVGVLLSKARGAGVVDVAGHIGRRLLYVRAAAYAQAINFPPIPRKGGN